MLIHNSLDQSSLDYSGTELPIELSGLSPSSYLPMSFTQKGGRRGISQAHMGHHTLTGRLHTECCGLNVPPLIHMLKSDPIKRMVLGGGACEHLGHEGLTLMSGTGVLIKEIFRVPWLLSAMRIQWAAWETEESPHPPILALGLPAPRTVRNQVLLFMSHQSGLFYCSSPNGPGRQTNEEWKKAYNTHTCFWDKHKNYSVVLICQFFLNEKDDSLPKQNQGKCSLPDTTLSKWGSQPRIQNILQDV